MKRNIVYLLLGLSVSVISGWGRSQIPMQPEDGTYLLRVSEKAVRPNVRFPMDAIPEEAYQAAGEMKHLLVWVKDQGKQVMILPGASTGNFEKADNFMASYALNGFFAGGELKIPFGNAIKKGSLTLYGSGVPVITSVRGEWLRMEHVRPVSPEAFLKEAKLGDRQTVKASDYLGEDQDAFYLHHARMPLLGKGPWKHELWTVPKEKVPESIQKELQGLAWTILE